MNLTVSSLLAVDNAMSAVSGQLPVVLLLGLVVLLR